jgi:hypothetical protein
MSKHPTDNPSTVKGPRRDVDDGDPSASPAADGAAGEDGRQHRGDGDGADIGKDEPAERRKPL